MQDDTQPGRMTTPREDWPAIERAMIERPADLEARSVYADHLAAQGDPLGEYLQLCVLEERGTLTHPQRFRKHCLHNEHIDGWYKHWNRQFKLNEAEWSDIVASGPRFWEEHPLFAGLPSQLTIHTPGVIDEVRLPIRALHIFRRKVKELKALPMPFADSLDELALFGHYRKNKLGPSALTWLQKLKLPNLRRLHVDSVNGKATGFAKMLGALSQVERLSMRATLPGEAAAVVDALPDVTHLALDLTRNDPDQLIGLKRQERLEHLELGLGHDHPPDVQLPVRTLAIPSSGAAWVARCPLVENLRVANPPPDFFESLGSAGAGIRSLQCWHLKNPASVDALVAWLPGTALEELDLARSVLPGRLPAIVAAAPGLHRLSAKQAELTDADLAGLAALPATGLLDTLHLGGTFSDLAIIQFAASPFARQLRVLTMDATPTADRGFGALLALPLEELRVSGFWFKADPNTLLGVVPKNMIVVMGGSYAEELRPAIREHWGWQLGRPRRTSTLHPLSGPRFVPEADF